MSIERFSMARRRVLREFIMKRRAGEFWAARLVARHAGEMISGITLATATKQKMTFCLRRSILIPPKRRCCARSATLICAPN